MADHRDPRFRLRRGHPSAVIGLSPDAERAYVAWGRVYRERVDTHRDPATAVMRIDHAKLEQALTEERDSVPGELLQIAVVDAQTRPVTDATVTDVMAIADAEWEVIQMLAGAAAALEVPVAADLTEDACRHGVTYSAVCADCEDDDL